MLPIFPLLLGLGLLGGGVLAASRMSGGFSAEWAGGDEHRWSEAKKLRSLHPAFRPGVERTLARLRSEGWEVWLYYGWRGLETQQGIKSTGNSLVDFSFHNNLLTDGTPAAMAVDIIHKRYAWGDGQTPKAKAEAEKLFDAVGRIGKEEGLFWGGDWHTFKDRAHLQLFPNSRLAEVRAAAEPVWARIA